MLCTTRNFLRLCRRNNIYQKHHKNSNIASVATETTNEDGNDKKTKDFQTVFEKYRDKIAFNSHLESEKLELGYFKYYQKSIKAATKKQAKDFAEKSLPPLPLALQYYVSKDRLINDKNEIISTEPHKAFQLPFGNTTQLKKAGSNQMDDSVQTFTDTNKEFDRSNINQWMTNYENFDDTKLQINDDEESIDCEWGTQYGTPDPSAGVSKIRCGGCGAFLHCSDPAIPGYLPSEILKDTTDQELKKTECQRCHFLKEYNIALDVNVQPEEYQKLLESIKHIRSLVILMVDLLDYPCSIWPGIVDIIGTKRPIIVVGNKVDLLPGDSIGYLKRVRQSLIIELKKTKLGEANIKHISLISAKTGYGVENLISAMFKIWLAKGDVFLVGCTNVGKSSLFNALLQSDYCKVHAVDIIKRATVSRWPGTTLNLLKFPINRPSGWKIYERTQRLKADTRLMKVEKEIRKAHIEGTSTPEMPTLISHIGRTFVNPLEYEDDVYTVGQKRQRMMVLNDKDELFVRSKWFYDTPGVIHPDQVLSLLTTEELLLTVPKQVIRPQTYYLIKGSTIFIGGLARIDFLDCLEPCRFTIFCSDGLPITVTKTEDANEIYQQFLGTLLFGAPIGSADRLSNWPGLKMHEDVIELIGEGPKTCCGDIVLSSVGWISVTAKLRSKCRIQAWTPEARGIHVRSPSLLPFAINLKGKRIRDTPVYKIGKVFVDDDYLEKNNVAN